MLNFTKTLYMGSAKSEGGGTPSPVDKTKYGITIDSILGDADANGVLQIPSVSGDLVFTGVKAIANKGLYSALANKQAITSVSFPDLETLNNSESMQNAFSNDPNITSVSFDKLKTVRGLNVLRNTFSNDGITSISFPELETVAGYFCCAQMFYYNSSLTSAFFPKLKSLSPIRDEQVENVLGGMFIGCDIRTLEFPMLSSINSGGCFSNLLKQGNKNLTSISFPALTTNSFGTLTNQFNYMFDSTTGQTSGAFTMHFPSNLESTIQGLTGYPDFGATAGRLTLAFDLPATE